MVDLQTDKKVNDKKGMVFIWKKKRNPIKKLSLE